MPKIPHSIIARLLAAPPSASGAIGAQHPDANLFSAFSENLLEKGERAQVMDHLASCAQCRDVLALQAAAASQMGVEVSRAKARGRGWLTKTELRWAAVAASVAVVAGIVLLRQPDRVNEPRMASSSATSPPQSQVAKTRNEAPAENKVGIAKQDKKRREAVAEDEISREATELTSTFGPPPAPGPSGSASSAGGGRSQALDKLAAANGKHPPKSMEPSSARVSAAKTAPIPASAATAATANGYFDREILKDKVAAPAPSAIANNDRLAASAPAVSASADASAALNQSPAPNAGSAGKNAIQAAEVGDRKAEAQTANTVTTSTAADAVRPQPTSETANSGTVGALIANPTMAKSSAYSTPARVRPPSERWRVEQGMLQLSENAGETWSTIDVRPGAVPGLAEAWVGQEVWAGDSQGGLSHSTDSGQHWQRVLYGGTENIAGATIVSVSIASAGQVVIRNSAGRTWITRDNGKTWRMK